MAASEKLKTADELLAMPDDGQRHGLVRGELITMPRNGARHGLITANWVQYTEPTSRKLLLREEVRTMMQEFLTDANIAGLLLAVPLTVFIIGLVIISIGPGLKGRAGHVDRGFHLADSRGAVGYSC